MTARRWLPPILTGALLAPALTACQLLGGGSALDDAFEVVPGDAVQVTFLDRAASAERLDTDDLETGADADDLEYYFEVTGKDPAGGTPLAQHVLVMQEAAFSEFDVAWWVEAVTDDGGPVSVYKVDDVDLDELVADLEDAGFDSEESDGRTLLTAGDPMEVADENGLIDGRYPLEFGFGVLVDPDEDLVATGSDLGQVVDVLDDEEDSLTDAGTFDDLADDVDDVELAYLVEDPPCGVGAQASEESIEQSGIVDLGSPTALGYFVSGDGDDTAMSGRLLFDDEDAAEADLAAREEYVEEGLSLRSGQPVSDLGSADLEQDGEVVRMDLDLENPTFGRQLAVDSDAFFGCAP